MGVVVGSSSRGWLEWCEAAKLVLKWRVTGGVRGSWRGEKLELNSL